MKTIEEVRELFKKDRFATSNGAVIDEIGENYAKCSLKIEERHLNALGYVMGGVYFMLADFAFAVAANWQEPGVVSLDTTTTFVGRAKGEYLTAEARCVKAGRAMNFYQIEVKDELGNLATTVQITGYRSKGSKIVDSQK